MSIRRLRTLAGLAATALALTACGGSDGDGGGAGGGAEDPYTIGVSFYSNVIPLYVEMQEGMEDKAEELGAELIFAYADNNAENQANQINSFVTQGVDIILASPVDAVALAPAYREARSAGIPIISVANKLQDESLEDAYIGPNLVDQAARTMERVAEGMGGSGQLLQVTGPPQIAFVQAQMEGWESVLADYPDIQVVDTVAVSDLSTAGALDATASALAANPGVTGIIASNDDVALGAIQAVEAAGIAPEDIFIAGWDGSDAALEAIREGTYDVTLGQRPYTWGQIAVQTAVDWLDGERPEEHRVSTPEVFIDQENVDTLTEEEIR
ncbi:sugar ABC transporter substrate-binding protein [Geodermatophilus sp. DF01-2]|uniref:sugar ABC transporter substrate-binding protein n=1 Tax=Geodermatophilus sp. DF01-2 TaxID=2559610 RepID=UPI00107471C8|nr:sugar ABC transporter substrate-binding protein [Geodermatophilus sp. DF01_2]TFV59822.1 sugar ABC transporter substrate-binding protein [Geodermatophilus sp. DF01_2]